MVRLFRHRQTKGTETDKPNLKLLRPALYSTRNSPPRIQLSKFINSLKSVSARLLFREFPELKNQLWGGSFWSPSYFLASTGQVTLDVLKRYVENQNAKDL